MLLPDPSHPAFGITDPLGLPRPIDPNDFFGARLEYFARNQMPIPSGCLSHFDASVYRPYLEKIVSFLDDLEFCWNGPVAIDNPPRYCLLRDCVPAEIPQELWPLLSAPPRVTLEEVLAYFDLHHGEVAPVQLLDVITLISEDIPAAAFAALVASHPWLEEFTR
jgi:hypothetical protein